MNREPKSVHKEALSLYPLDRVPLVEPFQVGIPAANLAQLAIAQHPVIETRVLPTQVLDLFLDRVNWQSPLLRDFPHLNLHLNVDRYEALQTIAQAIHSSITSTSLPDAWIAQWLEDLKGWDCAGLWLTPSLWLPPTGHNHQLSLEGLCLPQACWRDPESLATGILSIWRSIYSASNLFLWARRGMSLEAIKLGILIQPLRATEVSGWLQSTPQHLFIQATHGLPLSVLQGEVTPDLHHLDRQSPSPPAPSPPAPVQLPVPQPPVPNPPAPKPI